MKKPKSEAINKVWLITHIYAVGAHRQYKVTEPPEIKGAFVHFIDEKGRRKYISGSIDIVEQIVK